MSRRTSNWAPVAVTLVLASLVAAAGCNALDFVPLVTVETTLSEDFQTSSSPKIVIDTFNGQIDVSRAGDGEVVVDVIKRASGIDRLTAQAALNNVLVSMIQEDNTITITAERMDRGPGQFGASVVIAVPAAAELELRTSNGRVICEQIEGPIEVRSSNGKLEIIEGRGPIKLKTSNGGIEIEAADAIVDARTSNGRIQFRGTLADEEQEFKTSNGRIELVLPDDAEFQLDAHSSNGRVHCDFPIATGDRRKRRNDLEGIVGDNPDPECSIEATSSNGSISIHRASEHDD